MCTLRPRCTRSPWVLGFGYRVSGVRFRLGVRCAGVVLTSRVDAEYFPLPALWLKVQGSGFRVWCAGFRVCVLGLRVSDLGFGAEGVSVCDAVAEKEDAGIQAVCEFGDVPPPILGGTNPA